jgi:hypothetical protein
LVLGNAFGENRDFCNAGIEEADAPDEELTRAPAAHKAPVQIAGEPAEEVIAAAAQQFSV